MNTYEESHSQGEKHKDKQEFEEVSGVVSEARHPICSETKSLFSETEKNLYQRLTLLQQLL